VFIKHIDWDDEEAGVANVLVSNGRIDILCFSHPFDGSVGDTLTEPLYCLDAENVVVSEQPEAYVQKNDSLGYFGYSVCGKLIDRKNHIVSVDGDILLSLENDDIPYDISEGDDIMFDVLRMDVCMHYTK